MKSCVYISIVWYSRIRNGLKHWHKPTGEWENDWIPYVRGSTFFFLYVMTDITIWSCFYPIFVIFCLFAPVWECESDCEVYRLESARFGLSDVLVHWTIWGWSIEISWKATRNVADYDLYFYSKLCYTWWWKLRGCYTFKPQCWPFIYVNEPSNRWLGAIRAFCKWLHWIDINSLKSVFHVEFQSIQYFVYIKILASGRSLQNVESRRPNSYNNQTVWRAFCFALQLVVVVVVVMVACDTHVQNTQFINTRVQSSK